MFTRIRWTLVGWSMLVLGLILVLLGTTVYVLLSGGLMDEVDRNLASRSDDVVANLHEFDEHGSRLAQQGYNGGLFYVALSSKGQILDNPQTVDLNGVSLTLPEGRSASYQTVNIQGELTRLYIRRGPGQQSEIATLVMGQSLALEQGALRRLQMVLLAGSGAGLMLSFVGSWFLAGRALVPIQTALRRQQEFVTDAAHELRTPLAILRSAVDLLNRHSAEPLQANRELFDDIRDEIGWLETLAGDMLTLARSDLDQLNLIVGLVDATGLVNTAVRRTTPLAESRGIRLIDQTDVQQVFVEGDPDRLQQILLILLDNALEHTPTGGNIAVTVKRQDRSVWIQVRDQGEGIPAEHLPHVFDRFYRADRARSRASRRAGLGLAIAKSLVEAHEGDLTIDSAVGRGTTVTIRLKESV